jgi:CRISPR/Cas system-associated exonuclease Cas4 (RecB family)
MRYAHRPRRHRRYSHRQPAPVAAQSHTNRLAQASEPEPPRAAATIEFHSTSTTQSGSSALAAALSPSQLRQYLDCQTRWWYRYALHLPDPPGADRVLGLAVHDAIAENFRQKIETKQDLPAVGVIALFRQAWPVRASEARWQAGEAPEDFRSLGEVLTRLYVENAAPRIEPHAVEVPVQGTIAGVSVRGRIDLLDIDGRVIDVKTAKKSPAGLNGDYRRQLATYAALTPAANGRARLDTLVKTKTVRLVEQSIEIGPADRRSIEVLYPLAQEGMRSGLYMPNRNSFLCSQRHCPYWERCQDEYGGQVKP